MALRIEDKEYMIEKELVKIDETNSTPEQLAGYRWHCNDATKVACIILATTTPKLQRFYEDYCSYEMNKDLMEK